MANPFQCRLRVNSQPAASCWLRKGRCLGWSRSRPGARRPCREHSRGHHPVEAVVVRVHGGTSDAMLRRHVSWASQLAAQGSLTRLWMLVDETYDGSGHTKKRLSSFAKEAGLGQLDLQVFAYTQADMVARFPVLGDIRRSMPDTQDVRDCFVLPCPKSLAWCFHVETLLLWWLCLSSEPSAMPSFVWVVEDDAGFSSTEGLAKFLEAYRTDRADLLANGLQPVEPEWVWRDAASAEFLRLCPLAQRWRCAEHVQRFSRKLMEELSRLSLQGVSGWSEMSAPSLCRAAGLLQAPLRPEHVGSVFRFDGKVPESAWPLICS
ncbi:unnamed protein product, partial [Polarella glacialis]